jgi:hypothetical protein
VLHIARLEIQSAGRPPTVVSGVTYSDSKRSFPKLLSLARYAVTNGIYFELLDAINKMFVTGCKPADSNYQERLTLFDL